MSDFEEEVFLADQFWKLFWTFYHDRVLCQSSNESHCKPEYSQVDVGDVMLNLFKRRGRWSEFLVWRTLRFDNRRRSQKWSPRKCGKQLKFKILTCVALLGWLNMLREYEQGNMTRGIWAEKNILHCFVIVISYCFSPALRFPVTIKAATNFSDG